MSQPTVTVPAPVKPRRILDRAVVRFAGDSGDGMQLTGEQFTSEAAWAGNDISTLPNFPAEIRAPAGTLFGVSSFQLQFGSRRVYTPGDRLDCLVAMNPAALKVHLADLKEGGLLILNTSAFEKKNLDRAGYAANPLEDPTLDERYRTHKIDITRLTIDGLTGLPLNAKEKDRCKNFFALGLVSWVYTRPLDPTLDAIKKRFAKRPEFVEANIRALKAGHAFATGLKMVADEMPEPIGPEFRKTFDEQNFGLPLKDSLSNLTVRVPLLDVRFFSTAVLIQRETGGNLSEILENLAHVVRERFKILRQVRVYTAHGRMTGYVLLALPAFLAIALMFINPEHMHVLFTERAGKMMVAATVVLQTIGYLWIRKIVTIEV